MLSFLKIIIAGILMTGYASGSLAAGSWWDSNWNYRVPLTVNTGDYQRSDRPVEVAIGFTSFLASVDLLANFDVNSIRVHEVDVNGEILLPENISFQFDPAADFNALNNAQGTLVFLLNGNTTVQTNRYFHVYFDVEGGEYTLPTFTSQVDVTDINDEGQNSFLISTFNADYYYQKQAGGFSSIIDENDNDWINYQPTSAGLSGPASYFRGIPNLVHPENHFHPGATSSVSTLIYKGPLKATIKSTTIDGFWEVLWEFFPQFARMSVIKADKNYWFLYEGTPGGVLDVGDSVVRSDGTETPYTTEWSGDLPNQEWVYFSDSNVNRSIFLAHHNDDTGTDSYFQLDNLMTVFGFGRDGLTKTILPGTPHQFTVGFTDSTDFNNTSTTIESAYKDISVTISPADQFDNEAPTTPGNLRAQSASMLVDLNWDAATDNIGVALYRISLDDTEVGTATGTSFQATGLNPNQLYNFSVIAEDANGNQSTPTTVSVTTLAGTGDTDPPTAPTGLIEDSATASAVAISWAASTDAQGAVASHRIFRDGTEVGTSTTTSFTDTTVQAGQTYQYTVSAIDDANNESSPSAALQVVTPTPPDTEAPSIPTGLTLNSVSANAISFSWTLSTDNQGTVTLYHIMRDSTEIGTSSVASYTDSTVAADTAHVYNVTAEDNAGNESAISADLNVDTTVLSEPALLVGYPFEEGTGQTVLDLSGNGNNGTLGGNVTRTSLGNTGEAVEFDGSNSHINLGAIDITTPTMSIALWFKADDFGTHDARLISKATGTASSAHYWMVSTISNSGQQRLRFRLKTVNGGTSTLISSVALTAGEWTHVTATYDGAVMKLYQNSIEVGSLSKTGMIATSTSVEVWIGANPDNTRFFDGLIDDVRIYGEALDVITIQDIILGNLPLISNNDNEAPTSPGNLIAHPTSTLVDLNWDAATDNVGVALYRISRDGTEVGTATGTPFQETGLSPNQAYNFSVIAEDANGNQSTPATVSVITLPVDTVAPSVPTGLIEDSATATTVAISWDASTDTQGIVTSYRIFRDSTEVGTSTTTSFTDTTVQADLTYLYSVSAIDDAGNESNLSATLQVITPTPSGNQSPTAVISANPQSGMTPLDVDFDATTSFDPDGTILTYGWDFGDGNTDTGTMTSHTFNTPGTYNVTLTVTDNDSNIATETTTITVDADPGTCVFAIENSISNGSFEEDLNSWIYHNNGGGSASVSSVDPYHCDFSAKLDFTASGSNVQLYQQTVALEANTDYTFSFIAKASTPRTIQVFLHKHTSPYNNYGLGTITANLTTEWQTFTYNFTSKGFSGSVNNGRLRFWLVTAQPGDTLYFDNVVIQKEGVEPPQPIEPSILTQPQDASVFIDQSATFSASAQGTAPLQYQWQRDGQDIAGANSASYTTDTLVATDDGASFSVVISNLVGTVTSNTAQLTVSVAPNQQPSASFTVDNLSGIAPLTVNFDASASSVSDGTIDSYSWDFGDGGTDTGNTTSNTFNTPGVYSVSLTVTDNDGESDTTTIDISVSEVGNQLPTAAFSATPLSGIAPLIVAFDASTSTDPDNDIATYSWNFDDSNTDTGIAPSHTFDTQGIHNVTLTVTDNNGNTDSETTTITVDLEPGTCVFAIENSISNGSFEEDLNSWIYHNNGGGSASVSSVDPYHCDFSAKLDFTASGSNVQLYQQTVALEANTDYTFSFTAKASTPRTIQVFLHKHTSPYNNYGLGTITANLTTEWQTFTYNFTSKGFSGSVNNGRLRFWLVTAQPGDTLYFDNVVIQKEGVEPPQPIEPSILTQPQDASVFIDQSATFSASAQGTAPLQYQWQRDGQDIAGANSASYTTDTLVATDDGASFSVVISNLVGTVTSNTAQLTVSVAPNQKPSASFSVDNLSGIAPLTVNFDASASSDFDGIIDSYSWDFGDSTADTGVAPSYTFNTPGVYDVTLTVMDNDGEFDTVTIQILVGEAGSLPPTVIISANPQSGIAPLNVIFDATTSSDPDGLIVTYNWDFGDGNTGTDVAPSHTFNSPGIYIVTLTVTDNDSNTATETTAITVNPALEACVFAIENSVLNGSFEEDLTSWIYHNNGGGSASVSSVDPYHCDFSAQLDFTAYGSNVQLYQQTIALEANTNYTFSFTAKASTPRTIKAFLHKHTSPYNDYGLGTVTANLTTEWQTFTYNFTSKGFSGSVTNGRLRFWLVTAQPGDTMFFDNIVIQEEGVEPPQPFPNILTQPQNTSAFIDQSATFSVSATGTAPLQYQWQRNGQDIAGANSASYTTDTLVEADDGASFSVVIFNSVGTVTSNTAQLTVSEAPVIPPIIIGGDRITWSKLSSVNGDILPPGTQPEQVAALIFDINNDDVNDFVIGSRKGSGPSIVWYERTTTDWDRHVIESDSSINLEAGGTFYDIDGDGDNDLVLGENSAQDIFWWENPFPNFQVGTSWVRRLIRTGGNNAQYHDHIFGDFDDDGNDEFAYWVNKERKLYLAEIPADPKATIQPWPATVIASFSSGDRPEGIDKADIDLDGIVDIVGAGHWFKLQPNGSFQTMVIDSSKRFTRTAVGQLIEGGRPEIITDSGDNGDGIGNLTLYEWNGTTWVSTDLLSGPSVFGHSLNIGDVDGDGHLDVFSGEMTLQSNTNSQMRILYGDGVGGFLFSELDVGFDDHESKVGDLDGDGDLDILRKPFNDGTPGIEIWLNEGSNPFSFWNRTVADSTVPWRLIFLEYGDIDKDGRIDLISGGWWWKNPGTISGNWVRQTIGSPMNQMAAVYDFDFDGDLDVIGTAGIGSQPNSNLHWAENDGTGNFTIHNNVQSATGTFLQGVTVAQFIPGQLQIVLSWQLSAGGVQLVNVPPAASITTDQWTVSAISGVTSEGEGLDHGDIDNDGDLDILTGINWLRNDGSGNWTQISMHENTTEKEADRNILVDMDGDSDLDAVIGYGHDSLGTLSWYEQPNNNPEQLWIVHPIANLNPSFPQSVDVADFDGDGDMDVVMGEHKIPNSGDLKIQLFENIGNDNWITHEVYTGDEHHDGSLFVDLDSDGDLDIISIGWFHGNLLIYENKNPF